MNCFKSTPTLIKKKPKRPFIQSKKTNKKNETLEIEASCDDSDPFGDLNDLIMHEEEKN